MFAVPGADSEMGPYLDPWIFQPTRFIWKTCFFGFRQWTCILSTLTSHISPFTSHLSHLTSLSSTLTSHLSPLTSYLSKLTSHILPLTSHFLSLTSHLSDQLPPPIPLSIIQCQHCPAMIQLFLLLQIRHNGIHHNFYSLLDPQIRWGWLGLG